MTEYPTHLKIGLALDHLAMSQPAYLAIHRANALLENSLGINVSAFVADVARPCLTPEFAVFHMRDTAGFDGHLICTSVATVLSNRRSTRAKRYYYIQDLEWTRNWFRYTPQDVESIKKDPSFTKICRSPDHKELLTKHGWDIHPTVVEDFDLDVFLKIIRSGRKE